MFWRYTVPILLAYALLVPTWLGGGIELIPWAIAALVAGLLVRFVASGPSPGEAADLAAPEVEESPLGLAGEARPPTDGVATGTGTTASASAEQEGLPPKPRGGPGLGLMDDLGSTPKRQAKPAPGEPKDGRPPQSRPPLPPGLLDW